MRTTTIFALACLTVSQAAFAQVYTTPVGYVSLGNSGAVAANTDVAISAPLLRTAEFAGTVSSVTNATTIVVSGTQSWSTTQWTADAAKPYILYATGGAQEGLSALVTGSTGSTLTVSAIEGNVTALTSGDAICIRPAWTMKTLIAPSSVPAGTQIFAYSGEVAGVNISPSQIVVSSGSSWLFTFGGSGTADNFIIYPNECLVLRTGASAISSLFINGEIPNFNHRLTISKLSPAGTAQDVRFAYTSPVNQGLLASGLGATAGDQLFIYNNAATGRNKAPSQIMVYSGTAWIGTFGPLTGNQDLYPLVGGQGYVFRAASTGAAGTRDWNSQQAYIPGL